MANSEREKIVMYLADMPDAHKLDGWPRWRQWLWAVTHPYRFGMLAGRSYAALEIYEGKHLEGK